MVYKFIRQNPIKMDDLGVPPFKETSICIYVYIYMCIYIYIYHDNSIYLDASMVVAWIGLRRNLNRKPSIFNMGYLGYLGLSEGNFPLNQSIDDFPLVD